MTEAASYTLKFANFVIARFADVLFPNSPIEVHYQDSKFHLYCEGQWCQAEVDEEGLKCGISEIDQRYNDDWRYPSLRINPSWIGWDRLQHLRFDYEPHKS